MDSLERCRIILGISGDNEQKMALLSVLLEKSREDIEAFCRDTFIDDNGVDVFPAQLKNVQEDLAIQRYRKRGAEGETSYSMADENVSFEDMLPDSVKNKLYPYRQLIPRNNLPKMV
jgi:hypothetical protein